MSIYSCLVAVLSKLRVGDRASAPAFDGSGMPLDGRVDRTGASASGRVDGSGAPAGRQRAGLAACIATIGSVCALLATGAAPALADSCANAAFRTGLSANLPDCRAYELVSPPGTGGQGSSGTTGSLPQAPVFPSADGIAVDFIGGGGFGDATSGDFPTYVAQRGAGGWASTSVTPTDQGFHITGLAPKPLAVASEGTQVVFESDQNWGTGAQRNTDNSSSGSGTAYQDVYVRNPDGSVDWISQGNTGAPDSAPYSATYDGSTPDLSSIVFTSPESLVQAAQGFSGDPSFCGGCAIANPGYLYDRTGGHTYLVDVDNSGNVIGTEGARLGGEGAIDYASTNPETGANQNAISADGSKIFFEVPGDPAVGGHIGLYMRENNQTTTLISQPAPGVSSAPQDAIFDGASADGSKVFFTTTQQLTADDQNTTADIYEYDTVTGQLTRITAGAAADPDLQGVVAISDDGSHVYFAADSQLLAAQGVAGQPNLYVYDTNTNTLGFAATLTNTGGGGEGDENGSDVRNGHTVYAFAGAPDSLTRTGAQATPDGMHLVFLSHANLTPPYNSAGYAEVYEYSAASGSIVCASCDPSGAPPVSDAELFSETLGQSAAGPPDPIEVSDDGSVVVFETAEPLVPSDGNGVVDVYEYEHGQVALISDGQNPDGSHAAGVTPSGSDIYFFSDAPLVPGEQTDGLINIYDARVDGGFPAPSTPAQCQGQDCHPALSPPALSGAGSVAFVGPGNLSAATAGASFHVLAISAAQRRAFARTGRLKLRVRVSRPGRVTVTLTAPMLVRMGARERTLTVTVAQRRVGASHAGTVTVRIALAPAARAYLTAHRSLRVMIVVGYSRVTGTARATLLLRGGTR